MHPDDLKRAHDHWRDANYPSLKASGRLANALPGWGLLAAPVDIAVLDPEATPYCVRSADDQLAKVLSAEWDRVDVLSRLPD